MNLLDRLQKAEKALATAEQELNKTQGKIDTLKDAVEKECGVRDIEEARKILEGWENEKQEKEAQLETLLDKIEQVING